MDQFIPYNKMSSQYDRMFKEHIDMFTAYLNEAGQTVNDYAAFYPSFGVPKKSKADFIIYGQAVNGWTTFNANDSSDKVLVKAIRNSNDYFAKAAHNPIDWVNVQWSDATFDYYNQDPDCAEFYDYATYRAFRSFFWNVTYKLICDYYDDIDRNDRDWSGKIVWSNLYKISGQKRNPTESEKRILLEHSAQLVMQEIRELKPRYCIFLTGSDWWTPFREYINPISKSIKGLPSFITNNEIYGETQLIVTQRPFNGNSDQFVKQILSVIK